MYIAIKTAAAVLILAATLTFTACSGEQPSTPPPTTTAAPEVVETPTPTPTPTPVVQKFGTPDSTFMETIAEAGAVWPDQREVIDEDDFNFWVTIDGVEIWNADTCGEVTLVHSGGEVALSCEGGRFFLKD